MSLRVTLDRSIFHGENFSRLAHSSLQKACRSGRVTVYHTPNLIEETLNLLLNPDRRDLAKEHLKFLIDVGNGRWFNMTGDVWAGEFEGKGQKEYLFLSRYEEQIEINNIVNLVNGGEFRKDEFVAAMAEKEMNFQKALGLRKLFAKMRAEVAEERRAKAGTTPRWLSFEQYYNSNWEHCGTEMIRKHLKTDKDPNEAVKLWVQKRSRYPYFTLWIKAVLYAAYYARVNHNARIDRHTQMDISLLVMAKDLDAVVSNEVTFMKSAFQALYGSTKEYLNLEQFVTRLQ